MTKRFRKKLVGLLTVTLLAVGVTSTVYAGSWTSPTTSVGNVSFYVSANCNIRGASATLVCTSSSPSKYVSGHYYYTDISSGITSNTSKTDRGTGKQYAGVSFFAPSNAQSLKIVVSANATYLGTELSWPSKTVTN